MQKQYEINILLIIMKCNHNFLLEMRKRVFYNFIRSFLQKNDTGGS